MEKRKPHYLLAEIKAQMTTVAEMNLTASARVGIRQAGMAAADALAVVRGLKPANFYKSMTTHHDHTVWQDVYTPSGMARPCTSSFSVWACIS